MPFDIPYTFIAGQKAKANEVNANFLGVKQFVDILEQQGATNELDIATLESNKANINGNSGYRFQVADAINSMDAVNLNTLDNLTANSKYYIGGFDLSKQSNTSIRATAGSCYDSTLEEMITSTGTLTLNTSSAGNNVTRYIFVVWNEDTLTAQLAMSTSSSTPSMPAGYTHYRRLGQFTTDSSGNVDIILKDGQTDVSGKAGFIGNVYGGKISSTSSYTATQNHWLYAQAEFVGDSNSASITVTINGNRVAYIGSSWKYNASSSTLLPIKSGQTVSITISGSNNGTYCQKYLMD